MFSTSEPTDVAKARLKYWDQLFRQNALSDYHFPRNQQSHQQQKHQGRNISIEVEGAANDHHTSSPSSSPGSSSSSPSSPSTPVLGVPSSMTMSSTGTHAYWCSYFDSSSDHRCTCGSSIILPFKVTVNAAFERLFGLSQSEIREMVMADGLRALSPLIAYDSFIEMHNMKAANFTAAPEKFAPQYRPPKESVQKYNGNALAVNKFQMEIPCNFKKICVYEVDGKSELKADNSTRNT